MHRRDLVIGGLALLGAPMLAVRHARALPRSPTYTFGVLNQRSVALIGEYWNPILAYLSRRTGVDLELRVGRTAPETTAMALRQELDFTYSNHLFWPDRVSLGYRVIARPDTDGIMGEIAVLAGSSIRQLSDLRGLEVGFPSKESFVGYLVTMDALLKAGIEVIPVFAGNQEGTLGQLRAGRIAAASVNSQLLAGFARREGLAYRSLWHSETYQDIPVMAHGRVDPAVVSRVREALCGMTADSEGMAILREVSTVWGIAKPIGFVSAGDKDYEGYLRFYSRLSPSLGAER